MATQWPGTSTDACGREPVTIHGDLGTFQVSIRGVTFAGPGLDRLEPVGLRPEDQFALARGSCVSAPWNGT